MDKTEVIVDTCFFNKLSNEGKNIELLKKVLTDLDYKPVVHPYIAKNELDMYSYFETLVKEGFVRVADYDEFILDEDDEELYEQYFYELHNDLRERLKLNGAKKHLKEISIPPKQTIFTYRQANNSLGDIHMILMAFFMQLPVILSEDADIVELRSLTKSKMSSSSYELEIFNVMDLILKIAQKEDTIFTKQELQKAVLEVRERKHLPEMKQAWNEYHKNE